MYVDDPKGDHEAMDKEKLRHPSLDLILPGGATGHSARATRPNCPAFIRKEGWYLCYQARIQGVGAGAGAHPWDGVSPFKIN